MASSRDRPDTARAVWAAALLGDLWGDALPPGPTPWRRVAVDLTGIDDDRGARSGYVVQGDALTLGVLSVVLSYVPDDAAVRQRLPAGLTARLRAAQA